MIGHSLGRMVNLWKMLPQTDVIVNLRGVGPPECDEHHGCGGAASAVAVRPGVLHVRDSPIYPPLLFYFFKMACTRFSNLSLPFLFIFKMGQKLCSKRRGCTS